MQIMLNALKSCGGNDSEVEEITSVWVHSRVVISILKSLIAKSFTQVQRTCNLHNSSSSASGFKLPPLRAAEGLTRNVTDYVSSIRLSLLCCYVISWQQHRLNG